MKILISNIGFGKASPQSLDYISKHAQVVTNTRGTRFTEEDFLQCTSDADIIISGTEKISSKVINQAKNLKLIARVGVGVDNIDLKAAYNRQIKIVYTPDAPSLAVPEFTLGLLLNLVRGIGLSDRSLHRNTWYRPMGRSLSALKIGIIGAGQIGREVIRLLKAMDSKIKIYYYDPYVDSVPDATKESIEDIFALCEIVSVHVPLNESTYQLISEKYLNSMPYGSYLINTSRGGIVNEQDLCNALQKNLAGAAIDVFEEEPYSGPLCALENCLLTAHIGSMTIEARALMENQVAEDVINFINNKPLTRPFINTQGL